MSLTRPLELTERLPGPPGDSGPAFAKDRLGFLEGLNREYGDFVPFRIGRDQAVFTGRPDHVEELFHPPLSQRVSKDYLSSFIPRVLKSELLFDEPDAWLEERRLAQPAFNRDRLLEYAPVMLAHAEQTAEQWHDGQLLNVPVATRGLTIQILSKTLFDLDLGPKVGRASEVIDLILDAIDERVAEARRLPAPKDLRLAWGLIGLQRLLASSARERHRSDNPGGDLLTSLARLKEGSPAPDQGLIRRVVVPLFFAGHETTAMCLAWTLLLLARHPDQQEKVAAEIEEVVGRKTLEPADIGRLGYLGNVFSESLRLYPPAWGFGRKLMQDDVLGGHELPAGTIVWISPWVMQRDPKWFDRPAEFLPERWQGDLHRRLPKGVFVPFGSGSRRCLGNTFATYEVALTLATFVRRWRFSIEPGTEVVPTPSMTLRAKNLHLTVHAR